MPTFHKLLFNPFYEKHDHELVGESRKELIKILIGEIEDAISAKSPFILILLGAVGVGKSFTLRELSARINDPKQFSQPKRVISARFDATIAGPPSHYIEFMFHSMMRSIGKNSFTVLRDEFDSYLSKGDKPSEALKDITQNFQNAFISFGKRENQNIIWNWLAGKRADLRELKKLGIVTRIDNPLIALEAFHDFSVLLSRLGYEGLVFCIDEAEELALSGTAQVVKALTQIKKVFEQNKNQLSETPVLEVPIIFCLAFTPGTYRLITGARTAERESARTGSAGLQTFLRRIGREYYIDPLTSKDIEELMKVLLNKARKEHGNSTEPFDPSAVKYLAEIAHGVPGYTMAYAKELLKLADEEQEPTINESKAKEWLVESGLIPVEGIDSISQPAKEVEL